MQAQEVIKKDLWKGIQDVLSFELFHVGSSKDPIVLTVGVLCFVIVIFILTAIVLKWVQKIVTRKLAAEEKVKFTSVFSFGKSFIYIIVLLIALDSIGFNITAVFAASAALLVGVGLALQTLIQDVISGIFILIDKTVHIGDIIEMDGKIGRVDEIKLRTTRAITRDNKVLIIPNHKYLGSTLYNWTQNGSMTRESLSIGVGYDSDLQLVEKLLIQAALSSKEILPEPPPTVLFTDFGDSALHFKLIFTMEDSFMAANPKSEIRFEIMRLFNAHQISIPFPQRDVTIINADQ